jgi:hypothetical protein
MRKERAHPKEGHGANAAAASRSGKADENGAKKSDRAEKRLTASQNQRQIREPAKARLTLESMGLIISESVGELTLE